MLTNLLFTNTHFVLEVLTALIFFFTAWLHLDSWRVDKKTGALLYIIGFFLFSLTAIIDAVSVSSPQPLYLVQVIKILGLIFVITGTLTTPKLSFPDIKKLVIIPPILISSTLTPLIASLYLVASLSFFKRVKLDRDKQLKKVGLAFLFFAASEFINIAFTWSGTENVFWSQMLANFGVFWFLSRAIQAIGIFILGLWAWGYIRFRPQIQLFAIFATTGLIIFLTTAVLFTALLLRNIEFDALKHLETDTKVLQLGLDSLKSEALANSKAVSADHNIETAIADNDIKALDQLAADKMIELNTGFLDIISSSGNILTRAADIEERSESFIGNNLFQASQEGQSASGIVVENGILAPNIKINAFSPIDIAVDNEIKIIGAVSTGTIIDSAFVDGVKTSTGLDAAVYGNDQVSATTLIAPDGKRSVGVSLGNEKINETVLQNGGVFTGKIVILDEPYYATFAPLKDYQDKITGMLFVGKPQRSLITTAERSIELTFMGTAILIAISIIPAYFLSKYIENNLSA